MKQKTNIVKHKFRYDFNTTCIVNFTIIKPLHTKLSAKHHKQLAHTSGYRLVGIRCVKKKK